MNSFCVVKADGDHHPPGEREVKGAYKSLEEDSIKQEKLVRKIVMKLIVLIRMVDKLLDKKTKGYGTHAP